MTATTADGINFVDENKARGVFAGLLKHIADTTGTHANEHFNEIGTTDAKEGRIGFAGDGLREQCLSGSGSTDHQNTFRNSTTELLEFLRVFQELNQFRDFFFGLFDTCDVLKRCLVLFLAQHARLALTETEGAFARHFDLANEEKPNQQTDHEDREHTI